jgi:[ribosomal protein S5]-alanine N-acetyltransferase
LDTNLLFNKFPTLETSRLQLGRLSRKDASALLSLYQNKELAQYNAWADIKTLKHAKQKIKQFSTEFKQQEKVRWGIFLKDSQQFIGNCVIYNFNLGEQQAEIGFNLMPDFWYQGFMNEAIITILEFLFITVQIQAIEAWVMLNNENSQKFLKKIGFTPKYQTFQSRLSGTNFQTFMIYKLSKQDWEKQKNQ